MNFTQMENVTFCTNYIPGMHEYREALGPVWLSYVIVGGLSSIGLFLLFVEQAVYAHKNAHSSFRNCIIWLVSIYSFMCFISILGFIIPRAWQVCSAVKIFYLMIGISKFADLTLLMYGSEEVMLWTLTDTHVHYNVAPLCVCRCIPTSKPSKTIIRLVLHGCYQLPFTQAIYAFSLLILATEEQVIGSQGHTQIYAWLVTFKLVTAVLGVYSLNILAKLSLPHLDRYQYGKKSFALRLLILATTCQSTIFDILERCDVFPCHPPISGYTYKITIETCVYITEMLIFGVYSYGLYHNLEFKNGNPSVLVTDTFGQSHPYKKLVYLSHVRTRSQISDTSMASATLENISNIPPENIDRYFSDTNNGSRSQRQIIDSDSFCSIHYL